MKKSRWSSWFLNDLPYYIFITLFAIILLSTIANTFRLYKQAEARHLTIGAWWWLDRITKIILAFTLSLWLGLSWYKDRLRKNLETIKHAKQMRKAVHAFWWVTVFTLVLVAMRFFADFYNNSDNLIFGLIIPLLFGGFLVHTLITSQKERRYYRTQPLCNIAAASLLEKHNKFVDEEDFDKAHNALVKACETAPEETFLWCHLAHFCELFRNNTTESDEYMAKAEELISTKKANSASDRACYFNYLGAILYGRGECEKGLEYIKQSIDIEPNPGRIKTYEEKLSEFNTKQQNGQANQS